MTATAFGTKMVIAMATVMTMVNDSNGNDSNEKIWQTDLGEEKLNQSMNIRLRSFHKNKQDHLF